MTKTFTTLMVECAKCFLKCMFMNAVHNLYEYRKGISTKPFNARGWRVNRCSRCLIAQQYCICQHRKTSDADVGFALLMTDTEILKPSNTGRLIADVIPNSYAFLWKRTEPNRDFLALLADPQWQPIVVFPKEYAQPEQVVYDNVLPVKAISSSRTQTKKPLFILLDGSWREARRIFRKSPYLQQLPMLSFAASNPNDEQVQSRYHLREASKNSHLATAEVAAKALRIIEHTNTAKHLDLWLDVFVYHYQQGVCQKNKGNEYALAQYLAFFEQSTRQDSKNG